MRPAHDDELAIDVTEETEENEQDLITYQISYYPADYTLRGYLDKWRDTQLVIPSFQRNYVWDQVRASKLIESFLLGLPVPGVFLYKDRRTNKLEVIDGQQRILSAIRFFEGRFDDKIFKLKNVHPRWNGRTFDELDEADRFQLQDAVLRATIVQQLDPDDNSSVYHIFERLNTGGMKLSPMEIRKCVYQGAFYELLEELNTEPAWRELLDMPRPERRLRDVELLLRILAMKDGWRDYDKPMKSFLNQYMVRYREGATADRPNFVTETRDAFRAAVRMASQSLGARPFHLRGRINLALLDSVLTAFFHPAIADQRTVKRRFDQLITNERFIETASHSTSDRAVVLARFEIAHAELLAAD